VIESNPEVVAEWQRQTVGSVRNCQEEVGQEAQAQDAVVICQCGDAKRFHSPKLDKCVELILQNSNCSQIVFCDNIAVHRWLVELLVQGGIPRERIAVINGDVVKDAAKRLTISDKFNGVPAVIAPDGTVEVEEIEPEFDVVIANQAAYEGIDLHRRTCIVYHLDLPWEPSTLRQRNGRAVRQGNLQSNVDIKFILARKSLDVVRFEYILGKLRWMSDLIESADNNLANPAADNELDSEQMVLFLAQDEESAKESIRELREQQERRRRNAIIKRCWEDVTSLWSRENAIKRTDDEEKRLILMEEQRQLLSRISRVPR
jgi:superfamily II DNA/RNA helicase